LDTTRDIAVVVGSLRKESLNRKVAYALAELAPANRKLSTIEIGQLPLHREDMNEKPPAQWTEFRDRIKAADAVLFVTPEYDRSVPAALKNALDVGSSPYGKSAWSGQPASADSVPTIIYVRRSYSPTFQRCRSRKLISAVRTSYLMKAESL
jgi:chromate reductase